MNNRNVIATLGGAGIAFLLTGILSLGACGLTELKELNDKLDEIKPIGKALVAEIARFNTSLEKVVVVVEGAGENDENVVGQIASTKEEIRFLRYTIAKLQRSINEWLGIPPTENPDENEEAEGD